MSASPKRVPQISARRARLAAGKGVTSNSESFAMTQVSFIQSERTTKHLSSSSADQSPTGSSFKHLSETDYLNGRLYKARKQVGRLRDAEARPRIASSIACQDLIQFMLSTDDPFLQRGKGRQSTSDEILGPDPGCCCIA